eukprot:7722228-Lingulodinium_polyedra.AAC.1
MRPRKLPANAPNAKSPNAAFQKQTRRAPGALVAPWSRVNAARTRLQNRCLRKRQSDATT